MHFGFIIIFATNKPKKKNYSRSEFKKGVIAFYGAEQDSENDGDIDSLWCHLTGWLALADIKAAHIAPKSLESNELSYLFRAGEGRLSDANKCELALAVTGTSDDPMGMTAECAVHDNVFKTDNVRLFLE